MKRLSILIIFLCLYLNFSYSENSENLSLEGTWYYQFSSENRTCSVSGDKVVNNSNISSSFKLAFYFVEEPYSGGIVYGYEVGSKFYDILNPNYQYTEIYFDCNNFETRQPPTGSYYPVVLLLKFKNSKYGIIDYITFPIYDFKNGFDKEIFSLKNDLQFAKDQKEYWKKEMYAPYVDSFFVANQILEWGNKVRTIERSLSKLGYHDNNFRNYANKSIISPYDLISDEIYSQSEKDNVPMITDFDYQNPIYSDIGSSNSSSGIKGKMTCPECNGTGKYLDIKKYDWLGRKLDSKEYCKICNKIDNPHVHEWCRSCYGTGLIDR